MNKTALIAIGVFVLLLGAVLLTREDQVKVGVKELALPSVAKDDVTQIEITGKQKATLVKEGAAWKVFDPEKPDKKLPVEESAIKAALDAIGELKAGDFVSGKKDKHAELEIDDEKGQGVKVMTAKGAALDVIFGKAAKGGGSYVRERGKDDVFVGKGRVATSLKKDVAGWRKRQIIDVKAEDITSVTVTAKDQPPYTVLAEAPPATEEATDAGPAAPKPKTKWKLKEGTTLPAGFRLDEDQLGRIASSLATLRAQDFAEDGTDDAKAGFAAPHAMVTAQKKDGRSVVLHFGNEDDKKRAYAKVEGDPQIYLVGSYQVKQAAKPLDELRALSLTDVQPDAISKVTFTAPGGNVVVEKKDGAWVIVEPKKMPDGLEIDPSTIAGQVAGLARLRATKMVGAGLPAATTGLDKPLVKIDLVADGKTRSIKIGKAVPSDDKEPPKEGAPPPPKDHYISGSIDDLVYAIGQYQKARYEKPIELFKKVAPPPQMGGPGGGISGMENLPPDVRKKLEESMKKGQFPG